MSVDAMSWAKRQKTGSSSAKLVLMIVADYADEKWRAWPSQGTIADQAELSKKSVRDQLQALEARGFIIREPKFREDGSRGADTITLQVNRPPDRQAPTEVECGGGEQPSLPPLGNVSEGVGNYSEGGGETEGRGVGNVSEGGGEPRSPLTTFEPPPEPPLEPPANDAAPKRARPKRLISEDWAPSEIDRGYGAKNGFGRPEIDVMAERFANHARQQGRKCSDWQAAWRNWVLEEVKRRPKPKPKVSVW